MSTQVKVPEDVVILEFEDWAAMYVDGFLVEQDHSIYLRNFCEILGIPVKFIAADRSELNEALNKLGHISGQDTELCQLGKNWPDVEELILNA